MIHWNPERSYTLHATMYGLDEDGKFDFDHLTHLTELGNDRRLSDIRSIQLPVDPSDVVIGITEFEYLTFDKENPFQMRSPVHQNRIFIRAIGHPEIEQATFAYVEDVIDDPEHQTKLALDLIKYIPEDQLNIFGVASLKRLVK